MARCSDSPDEPETGAGTAPTSDAPPSSGGKSGASTAARGKPLRGGELNAVVTRALVGIHADHLGKGPTSATTFHHRDVIVTLMHDVLTPAERSLVASGSHEAVSQIRHLFQQAMEPDFRAAVERLTGRKVRAFLSGNQLYPDIAAELFILDEPI